MLVMVTLGQIMVFGVMGETTMKCRKVGIIDTIRRLLFRKVSPGSSAERPSRTSPKAYQATR